MEEKEKGIIKNKAHIVKAAVETLNLNISYLNESDNSDDDDEDDNDITYEKKINKTKKKRISIYLNK